MARWLTLAGRQPPGSPAAVDGAQQHAEGAVGLLTTGTDEHGIKVQEAAERAGVHPQQFCDGISAEFRAAVDLVGCDVADFVRTTEARHGVTVEALWRALEARGEIYMGKHEGWYCRSDEAFLTEMQVTMAPPVGNLDGPAVMVSKESGHPVEWIEEENYKFRLSKWAPALRRWLEENPDAVVPAARRNEVLAWIDRGLSDLSVSRLRDRVGWALQVPGNADHSIYVWLDALSNYLTVAATDGEPLALVDQGDSTGALRAPHAWPGATHVVGKDILRFHAVYWPAFLMAAGLPLPKRIVAHAHWTVDKVKMSKSIGNVVSPSDMLDVCSGDVDGVRFFLMREGGLTDDADFSAAAVVRRYNADLADSLGNLLSRLCSPALLPGAALPRPLAPRTAEDDAFVAAVDAAAGVVGPLYARGESARALEAVMALVHEANRYVATAAPWTLKTGAAAEDAERLSTVMYLALEAVRVCGLLLSPVTPRASRKLLAHVGVALDDADAARDALALRVGREPGAGIGTDGKLKLLLFKKLPEVE